MTTPRAVYGEQKWLLAKAYGHGGVSRDSSVNGEMLLSSSGRTAARARLAGR